MIITLIEPGLLSSSRRGKASFQCKSLFSDNCVESLKQHCVEQFIMYALSFIIEEMCFPDAAEQANHKLNSTIMGI